MSIKRKDRTTLRRCVQCGVVRIDPRGWRACPMCPFSASVPITDAVYANDKGADPTPEPK